ncbi:hypothetical protein GCM10008170_03260 [Methylopila capsulata]|uniref:Uncharacterized protein n=1 Tax=Methylopila capsulata TaxID=61654 RepID=A0A9W6IRG5_9HYPH|nr:hypothetical protein GCM10008170_03260 [Methylopila capsulata]
MASSAAAAATVATQAELHIARSASPPQAKLKARRIDRLANAREEWSQKLKLTERFGQFKLGDAVRPQDAGQPFKGEVPAELECAPGRRRVSWRSAPKPHSAARQEAAELPLCSRSVAGCGFGCKGQGGAWRLED